MSSFAAITTTPTGLRSLLPLCAALPVTLWIPEGLASSVDVNGDFSIHIYRRTLRDTVADLWSSQDGLIFALATGAVVRLIAPLLQDKATDPAVVVVDEAGQFAISLCGGHQGGGDRLAHSVSHALNATPVLTGAANRLALPGIDVLGQPFGWGKGTGDWTGVASAIAREDPIQVIQEAGSELWQRHLPPTHCFQFGWPDVPALQPEQPPVAKARVWISPIQRRFAPDADLPKVQWHPRVLWVGVGCERGTSQALIEQAITEVCRSRHLSTDAIAGIATLDLKADEVGLAALCQARNWPLRCFTAGELRQIAVPHPSKVVENAVGTPSVAEAAAILAAHGALPEIGDAPALYPSPCPQGLCVSKKVIRRPDQAGAVTIAIAQAEQEYTGRIGHLALVGIGPGRLDQITPAAKTAIAQADAVIGYSLYMDLIRPLLRPGQIVEAMPITQEQQRADRAIALANWGLAVAVISSGDCGIYAMAGLVLETLQAQGWEGDHPTVESFPGISALQAAAARVGAPLMHDFCAISLSNLLTPWSVIEKRLQAAAKADFVVALYNPKSQKRTEQIAIAQRLFAQYRPPETPVAIVQSAYRPHERIVVTTVAEMLSHPIDMLTTVIVGNCSTRLYAGTIITPRGYSR
ncbi:MAG: precorrin-3B C(17)-methyltransferase [Leptolyngbya sp. SIO1E4]|nr:precorrin-3B C(17)-methyltransferase [Leptolyngbya sp. SIO1E4]